MRTARSRVFLLVMLTTVMTAAMAQNYPARPIRIVTGSAGGGQDLATRIIAQGVSRSVGQPVIVENRGGSGLVAAEIVAKAPPEGYTLLMAASPHWIQPLLQDDVPYDPIRDFSPVTMALRLPNMVVVHPSLPVHSIRELIDLAKAKPGVLNYGSSGTGASTHLSAELFKAMAGVNIVRVAYKGGGPALNALLGGEVQVWFPNVAAAMAPVKSGKIRALAVTSAEPSVLLPGLPAVSATVPGYDAVSMIGVFVQDRTPPAIVNRLHQEIVRVLNSAEARERLTSTGAEVIGSSPNQFGAAVKLEMTKWAKVIKDAGIRGEKE